MRTLIAISAIVMAGCAAPRKNCGNCATLEEELRYARSEMERASRDLAEVESKLADLWRERQEEEPQWVGPRGARFVWRQPPTLEGSVRLTGPWLLLDIGKSSGVSEGDEFTVYRGNQFVAKLQVTRVEAGWSAAAILFRKSDPMPGDPVTNDILMPPARSATSH